MKVLVTGANGFLGRSVVPALEAGGHAVVAALRSPARDLRGPQIVVGEIGPESDWTAALQGIDAVVHLAARVHVMRDSADGAAQFERTNTQGSLQLARAAARAGVRRFVFISTIKVNGDATTTQPFRADDAPAPTDAYSRSKHAAELGLEALANLEYVIIRPPLVHGPGAKGNLARFCRLAALGLPVPLGGIHNRRDLIGVANLADLIARCLVHPAAVRETFLASDGEGLSTADLYRAIAEGMGRRARMFPFPESMLRALARPVGFGAEIDRLTQSLAIDIAKTRDLLGWNPAITARQGLGAMARAYLEARR